MLYHVSHPFCRACERQMIAPSRHSPASAPPKKAIDALLPKPDDLYVCFA